MAEPNKLTKKSGRSRRNALRGRALHMRKDEGGNVGMMFAVCALPLIIAVGAAIDYSQMTADVQKAQDSVDAAVLAAAHEYYVEFQRSDSVQAGYISSREHLKTETATGEHTIVTEVDDSTETTLTLKSSISGTTRHAFMGMVGKPETPWTTVAYSEVSIPKIEIVLVVDFSMSMRGAKIEKLKSALKEFVEDVAPYRKGESHIAITMIPFAENINFGPEAEVWLEASNRSRFNGCFKYSESERPGSMEAYPYNTGVNGFPFCPPTESKAVLFSTNASDITDQIDKMGMGFGTDTERGLIWAERFLDNYWRGQASSFSEALPITMTRETEKIILVLTDGAVAVTDADENGRRDSITSIRRRQKDGYNNFTAQCNELKKIDNVHIFPVGYNLSAGTTKNRLKGCVAGDGQYFDATTGNLDAIFQRVSDRLTPIRISG